ncbi:MAG: LuxR family transcriptional regulator [Pedobacter sp.]|nr:MAG: LuxR family transcriptional regulator [Pedobacter sp.]
MEEIKPILPKEFIDKLQTRNNQNTVNYKAYFEQYIAQTINYAIGPYCWFIPDNRLMKIAAVSDNIRQLTPFTKKEWVGQGPEFLAANTHPDDFYYLLSATALVAEIHEKVAPENRGQVRVNIYCRMLDAQKNYRWTLVQYIAQYFNEDGKIESTLCLMTDLSHFKMIQSSMMTVIDNNNKEHQYFKVIVKNKKLQPIALPHITKREQQLLQLITKGFNTPQMAKMLNLSYHTIENHKRNLRQKTGSKTAAELVHFVMDNNLL